MVLTCIWIIGFAFFPTPEEAAFRKTLGAHSSSTQKVWEAELARKGGLDVKYKAPTVSLFSDEVVTACGTASTGPYYCEADSTAYVDRTFFAELDRKLGGQKAECAKAYVFAGMTAKHVMNQAGFLKLVANARKTNRENELIVRAELCASYLAGVWAHHAQKEHKYLAPANAEDAIMTVRAIGDDRVQVRRAGAVRETWNHGTSRQHVQFFLEGLKTGDASKERVTWFFEVKFDPRKGELADK